MEIVTNTYFHLSQGDYAEHLPTKSGIRCKPKALGWIVLFYELEEPHYIAEAVLRCQDCRAQLAAVSDEVLPQNVQDTQSLRNKTHRQQLERVLLFLLRAEIQLQAFLKELSGSKLQNTLPKAKRAVVRTESILPSIA